MPNGICKFKVQSRPSDRADQQKARQTPAPDGRM